MPHISGYIKEALEEEKYGDEFNSKIGVRVQEMNTAQLQKMYDALNATYKDSGFQPWGEANAALRDEIHKVLVVRIAQDTLEEKKLQAIKDRERRNRENERMKRLEKKRVLRMIKENAISSAAKYVKEKENDRKIAERVNMVHVVAAAEIVAMKMLAVTSFVLILGVVLVALLVSNPLFSGCGIGVLFLVAFYMCYRAYKVTDIEPLVVTQEDLDSQIEEKEEELIATAMDVLRQQEIKFNKGQKLERQERKRAVRELKEKRRRDAELAAEKALEVAAMAASLEQDDVYVPTTDEQRRKELIAAEEEESRSISSSSSGSEEEEDDDEFVDEDEDVGEGAEDEFEADASGSNSRTNSRPTSASRPPAEGFVGMGRRLSSKLFSTSSSDLERGQLQRRPSMLQSFMGSVKGTPVASRTNSTVGPMELGGADLAQEASLPLPQSKPPLFAKMVSRLSSRNIDVGVAGVDRGADEPPEPPAPAEAKSSRFSLFGRKEEKKAVVEEVIDYSPVTLADVLRVLPASVQCVDMKENIARDALIMVSVQDVPFVYNYQAELYKKANTRVVNHGFSRPSSVAGGPAGVGEAVVPLSFVDGIASGSPPTTAGASPKEVMLPRPTVPKIWPITDRPYKSHSLQRLIDEVDHAHLTAQYAMAEQRDDDDDDDIPSATQKTGAVMFDGQPLPEINPQQTAYLKDKIQIAPNYSRRQLDAKGAENGGESAVLSTGVLYTVLEDTFEDEENDLFYVQGAEKHRRPDSSGLSGDWPTSSSPSNSDSDYAEISMRPSSGSREAGGARRHSHSHGHHHHHLHHHHTRSITQNIIHKNASHANLLRKGVLSSSSYITVAVYLPKSALSPFLSHNAQSLINMYQRREEQLISQYVYQLKSATARYLRHLGPAAAAIKTEEKTENKESSLMSNAPCLSSNKNLAVPAQSSKIVIEKGTSSLMAMKRLSTMFSSAPKNPLEDASKVISNAASVRVRRVAVVPKSPGRDITSYNESSESNVKSETSSYNSRSSEVTTEQQALEAKLMPVHRQANNIATLSDLAVQLSNTTANDAALKRKTQLALGQDPFNPKSPTDRAVSPSLVSDSDVMSEVSEVASQSTAMTSLMVPDIVQLQPDSEDEKSLTEKKKKKKKKGGKVEEEAVPLPNSPKTPKGGVVPPPAPHLLAPPLTLDHSDSYPHQAYRCMGYVHIYLSDFLRPQLHEEGEVVLPGAGDLTPADSRVGTATSVVSADNSTTSRPSSPAPASAASKYVNPNILPIYDLDKGTQNKLRDQEVLHVKFKTEHHHHHDKSRHGGSSDGTRAITHVSGKGSNPDHKAPSERPKSPLPPHGEKNPHIKEGTLASTKQFYSLVGVPVCSSIAIDLRYSSLNTIDIPIRKKKKARRSSVSKSSTADGSRESVRPSSVASSVGGSAYEAIPRPSSGSNDISPFEEIV